MDILNQLPDEQFEAIDDLLAFISIYDDEERTKAYMDFLSDNKHLIEGKVCMEAGCGLGIMSAHLVKLGAKKVISVEMNPHLFQLASQRLAKFPNVEVIQADIREYVPTEKIDVLVHEFYGQLLYDEELYVLNQLKFKPGSILPNGGKIRYGLMGVEEFEDEILDKHLLSKLKGALVSGLFDEEDVELEHTLVEFKAGELFPEEIEGNLEGREGNLLYFGIEVCHDGKFICRSGECSNWSYAWTHRSGDRFKLAFPLGERAPEPVFDWID